MDDVGRVHRRWHGARCGGGSADASLARHVAGPQLPRCGSLFRSTSVRTCRPPILVCAVREKDDGSEGCQRAASTHQGRITPADTRMHTGGDAFFATAPDGCELHSLADAVMIHRHSLSSLTPETQLERARLAARALMVALHPDLADATDLNIQAEIVEMRNLPQISVPYVEIRVCSTSCSDQDDAPAVSTMRTQKELRPELSRTETGRLRYSIDVRETLTVAVQAKDARGRLVLALCDGHGSARKLAMAGSSVSSPSVSATVGKVEFPLAKLTAVGSVGGWYSLLTGGIGSEGWEGQAPQIKLDVTVKASRAGRGLGVAEDENSNAKFDLPKLELHSLGLDALPPLCERVLVELAAAQPSLPCGAQGEGSGVSVAHRTCIAAVVCALYEQLVALSLAVAYKCSKVLYILTFI